MSNRQNGEGGGYGLVPFEVRAGVIATGDEGSGGFGKDGWKVLSPFCWKDGANEISFII